MPATRTLLAPLIALALLAGCTTAPTPPTANDADLLIRNGQVLDGTGRRAFPADIAVRDGRILAIGDLAPLRATRTLDASRPG